LTLSAQSMLLDVAFAVCTALDRAGVAAVMVGGSAATFYVPDRYQSLDVDLVLEFGHVAAEVNDALASIGFMRAPEGHFTHEDAKVPYTVEFPAGPLSIGSARIETWNTVRRAEEVLNVLWAYDAMRDRFMHFYAWGDVSAYGVALAIGRAQAQHIDWEAFEAWAEHEASLDSAYDRRRLDRFLRELRKPVR
jgi:hypothetical protein